MDIESILNDSVFTGEHTSEIPVSALANDLSTKKKPDPHAVATVQHLGMLYDGMKDGRDKTLLELHDVKTLLADMKSEYRVIREYQTSLSAKLDEISAQVNQAMAVQCDTQVDLAQLKTEVGICTAGYSKINSALLEMTLQGVLCTMEKLPESKNFVTQTKDDHTLERPFNRITPVTLTDSQLIRLFTKAKLDANNFDEYCKLLNNRTSNYFSKVFPTLFPGVSLSVPPALSLLRVTLKRDPKDYLNAVSYIRELITLRTPQVITTAPVMKDMTTSTITNTSKVTMVKKCNSRLGF